PCPSSRGRRRPTSSRESFLRPRIPRTDANEGEARSVREARGGTRAFAFARAIRGELFEFLRMTTSYPTQAPVFDGLLEDPEFARLAATVRRGDRTLVASGLVGGAKALAVAA